MPEYTTNYNLIKPLDNETADIAIINQNMDTIDGQIKQNASAFNAHLAESMIHATGGTANAVVVNTGGDFDYVQGAHIKFKAVADNTGDITINVDGKGIKSLKKLDGSQIPAGGIKSGKVYEIYYDSVGDCFFVLARAEGDAVAGDVLAGKVFSNGDDTGISGNMTNCGAVIITPNTSNQTIPSGYHNGTGYVKGDANLVAGNIKSSVSIFGVSGKSSVIDTADANATAGEVLSGKTAYVSGSKVTGTMTNRGAYNITPSASNITIPAGYHNGAGIVYGDTDLVANNIKSGVNILGVTGSYIGEAATGYLDSNGTTDLHTVSGLSFNPTFVIVRFRLNNGCYSYALYGYLGNVLWNPSSSQYSNVWFDSCCSSVNFVASITLGSGQFTFKPWDTDVRRYYWSAIRGKTT